MVYSFLFVSIVLYSYAINIKTRKVDFLFFFLPIAVLLVLILSLQYNVGTDYESYISIANGSKSAYYMEAKSEYLFVYLIRIVKLTGKPQLIFMFTAIIQVIFFMLITFEVKRLGYYLHNFFFLYFTLSLVFFNQFNGIRQYIAVYLIVYALFQLKNNNKLYFLILVALSSMFHSSAIFFMVFLLIGKFIKKRFPFKIALSIIVLLLILSFLDFDFIITKLLSYTKYSHYAYSDYFGRVPLRSIITKLPKIFIVLFSSYVIDSNYEAPKKEEDNNFLINMSYIAISVMVLSFSSTIIWRFYQYLDLFIVFPVLILMQNKNNKIWKILISFVLIMMILVKIVILPEGEYLYQSILPFR